MELLTKDGPNPLPKSNHRNKKRHPQNGVEIEQKWAKPGYVHLTSNKER